MACEKLFVTLEWSINESICTSFWIGFSEGKASQNVVEAKNRGNLGMKEKTKRNFWIGQFEALKYKR
jgi:hypothetical protein